MSAVLRKRVARSHAEAYDLWAREFVDPALMANRDAETTRRKLERVAAGLPLEATTRVLDVGPGDGALFRHVAGRVAACCGVDPSDAAVAKLRGSSPARRTSPSRWAPRRRFRGPRPRSTWWW